MSGDELVEVVDADGAVLEITTRSVIRSRNLRHRCVFIAVVTGDGRLLIHRRSPDKDVWGGYWDVAAGGVVGAGEGWLEAAERELSEELGVEGVDLEPLGRGAYEDADVSLIGEVFVARTDGPFDFADGEVVEARTVGAAELDELLADPARRFVPDSVRIVLPLVQRLISAR